MGLRVLGALVALGLAGCTAQTFQVLESVSTFGHELMTNRIYTLYGKGDEAQHAAVDFQNRVVRTNVTSPETTQTLQPNDGDIPTSAVVVSRYTWLCTEAGDVRMFEGETAFNSAVARGTWCLYDEETNTAFTAVEKQIQRLSDFNPAVGNLPYSNATWNIEGYEHVFVREQGFEVHYADKIEFYDTKCLQEIFNLPYCTHEWPKYPGSSLVASRSSAMINWNSTGVYIYSNSGRILRYTTDGEPRGCTTDKDSDAFYCVYDNKIALFPADIDQRESNNVLTAEFTPSAPLSTTEVAFVDNADETAFLCMYAPGSVPVPSSSSGLSASSSSSSLSASSSSSAASTSASSESSSSAAASSSVEDVPYPSVPVYASTMCYKLQLSRCEDEALCSKHPLCRLDVSGSTASCVPKDECKAAGADCLTDVYIDTRNNHYEGDYLELSLGKSIANIITKCELTNSSGIYEATATWLASDVVRCNIKLVEGTYSVALYSGKHQISENLEFQVDGECLLVNDCRDCIAKDKCKFIINRREESAKCVPSNYELASGEEQLNQCPVIYSVTPDNFKSGESQVTVVVQMSMCVQSADLVCQLDVEGVLATSNKYIKCISNTTAVCEFDRIPGRSSLKSTLKLSGGSTELSSVLRDMEPYPVEVVDCHTDKYDCIACTHAYFQNITGGRCQWSLARAQCMRPRDIPETTLKDTVTNWTQCPMITRAPDSVNYQYDSFAVEGTNMDAKYDLQVVLRRRYSSDSVDEYWMWTKVESSTRLVASRPTDMNIFSGSYEIEVVTPNGRPYARYPFKKVDVYDTVEGESGLPGYGIALIVIGAFILVAAIVVVVVFVVKKFACAGGAAAKSGSTELK